MDGWLFVLAVNSGCENQWQIDGGSKLTLNNEHSLA